MGNAAKFTAGFRAALDNFNKGMTLEDAVADAIGQDADVSWCAGVHAGEAAAHGWRDTYRVGRHHGLTREQAVALEDEAAAGGA